MASTDLAITVDASVLLKLDLHDLCVLAVNKMVDEGIENHISWISGDDAITFGLKEGGRIPKVTIEWVNASDNDPKETAGR